MQQKLFYSELNLTVPTLQKQSGCFNHSIVTLVADMQAKETLVRLSIANCIRQPLRKLPRPYLTTRILQLVTTEEGVTPACIKSMQ